MPPSLEPPPPARDALERSRRLLAEVFGFPAFRSGQEAVVERLLADRSVLAVFPTGAGKSLCYQLPALQLEGLTLVVSPLIALMKDQVDALQARGVAAARLDSSLSASEARAVTDALERGALRLLYVAPERLANERFLARLRRQRLALLAIDEAHCISEWGHNFRPDYLKVARLARELGFPRVLALTATATPAVAADVRREFAIAPEDQVQTGFYRPNLALRVTPVAAEDKRRVLLERLGQGDEAAVVYVTLQHTSESLAEWLVRAGLQAAAYHAGLDSAERASVQEAFMAGRVRVVVATIAFGMGIDKADIRTVIHFDLPKTLENYSQEVGRAGRDGAPARCELLACADDTTVLENFTWGDTPTPEALRGLLEELLGPRLRLPGEAADTFSVSRRALSERFDIREQVVATALTYLELEGVLEPTAPFYAECRVKLHEPPEVCTARLPAERATFLSRVLAEGREGRTWLTLEPDAVAERLGVARERVVGAIDWLEEEGLATVQASGLRHGYRVLRRPERREALIERLVAQFARRELRDVARVGQVLAYARDGGCLPRHLLAYFGEALERDCGQCSSCLGSGPRTLPHRRAQALGEAEAALAREVASEGHAALGHPRQLARFLCGLTSPQATRARLGRQEPRFGALADAPFPQVLALCEQQATAAPAPREAEEDEPDPATEDARGPGGGLRRRRPLRRGPARSRRDRKP